jgi:hypothetical protein
MSNTQKLNKKVQKRRAKVQEVEDVEVVDRRGNIKPGFRDVPREVKSTKSPKDPLANSRKRPRQKSPSPVAGGSTDHTWHPRKSKVYLMFK